MIIIKAIVTVLNLFFMIILYFFDRKAKDRVSHIGFKFMIILMAVNTALIWIYGYRQKERHRTLIPASMRFDSAPQG